MDYSFLHFYKDILTKDTIIVDLDIVHPREAAMTGYPSITGSATTLGQHFS